MVVNNVRAKACVPQKEEEIPRTRQNQNPERGKQQTTTTNDRRAKKVSLGQNNAKFPRWLRFYHDIIIGQY